MKKISIVLCGLLVGFGVSLVAAGRAAAVDRAAVSGTWSLNHRTPGNSVRLELSYRKGGTHWQWGNDQLLSDLAGLTSGQLHAAHTAVGFAMDRDAGRFTFEGSLTLGVGGGDFRFVPNPTYVAKLNMLGYECRADDDASVMFMAVRDISLEYAGEVKLSGLEGVTVKDLTRLLDHAVSLEFIRELAALGYARRFSADDVIGLRDHGVEAAYVARVQSSGYSNLTVPELIKLHDHGVD